MTSTRRPQHSGLQYRLISRLIHHPRLLRIVAAMLKGKPSLARIAQVVADRDSVAAVFHRDASFSSAAHAPNLRAGEFVIGMDSGARQRSEREFLKAALPSPERFRAVSAAESRRRINDLRKRESGSFDLIDDYMVRIVWRALRRAVGPAGIPIAESSDPAEPDQPSPRFTEDLRSLGAHLIIGSVAPPPVRKHADRCAAELNRRVLDQSQDLGQWWGEKSPGDSESIQRNAVGLMWVGHPATVQAGALVMQELLARRAVLDDLSQQAQALNGMAWTDPGFRQLLTKHVLELLRFRPPFPILNRAVPRDTWFDVGRNFPAGHAKAGSQVTLLSIGALFDNDAMTDSDADAYKPGRGFKVESDRHLMFGTGARSCIAKHQVVEMLVSSLAGLLTLPRLRWADPWYDRIAYDGPTIRRLRLKFDR